MLAKHGGPAHNCGHPLQKEFDMVKVTRDPGDTRWVRARELDLVFCQKPLVPKIVTGGGSNEIRALTMGSGEGCP